ncbi:gtp-binding protein rheb [Anaeramoeba flamelloides]|uniref:Gtp-binding protein rheb n=1 Tax=Anaeramoeba flamelloides TaxID=1746091 RepID=A0AAV7YU17_9EUKA|nr:gtp-binding protein rheb [Anaeramoeba flamelloides]KAJ6228512.1 gtp-binding protein rheb [Anaeramoeba flamelloides]
MPNRKVVVLGSKGVGKTSIIQRFVSDGFSQEYTPTIENTFQKKLTYNGLKYDLTLVDTRGQDKYATSITSYTGATDGFVLVYNVCDIKSFELVSTLNEEIQFETGGTALIVVGNMTDLGSERQVSREQGEKLAENLNCEFIECSAKDNININKVFLAILEEIEKGNGSKKQTGKKENENCIIL